MRILNEDSDKSINNILLCLTESEAKELMDSLRDILNRPKTNHAHIPSEDYEKELTICLYNENDVDSGFSTRVKELIIQDK